MSARVVIVGAGQAGFETARTLRDLDFDGSIAVIGDETAVPYQRPPLSKACLGQADRDVDVSLQPLDFYSYNRIDLIRGDAVTSIDRVAQEIVSESGARFEYDHLVLATGTRNRVLSVPGSAASGVHYLRTLDEARSLNDSLSSCTAVVVVGGGFIGLEVAAAATARGIDVTIVEALDRPMARAVTATTSSFFVAEHQRRGARWKLGKGVESIVAKRGRVSGVLLTDGEVVTADLVVVGVGVVPNVELAADAGLRVDNGVVVDRSLLTSDPTISAVGDCATYDRADGRGRIRLESVQNAVDQARFVAARLCSSASEYSVVPWFWTVQYSNKLQIAGISSGCDREVVRGSLEGGAFSIFCYSGDTLVSVESVNRVRDHITSRRLLAAGVSPTPQQVTDTEFDLRSLVGGTDGSVG